MNVGIRSSTFKFSLQPCLQKIKTYDLDEASVYGKFAVSYEDNGYRSVSSEALAALINLDLANERVR